MPSNIMHDLEKAIYRPTATTTAF